MDYHANLLYCLFGSPTRLIGIWGDVCWMALQVGRRVHCIKADQRHRDIGGQERRMGVQCRRRFIQRRLGLRLVVFEDCQEVS